MSRLAFKLAFSDSCNNLPPEMGATARLTLDYPLSYEMLGDGLRLFSGSALRELAGFRKTCRNNIVSLWKPSWMLTDAHRRISGSVVLNPGLSYPSPFTLSPSNDKFFTHAIIKPSSIREKYLAALMRHSPTTLNDCPICLMVYAREGEISPCLIASDRQVLVFV
jgi:hypothetical protein